MAQTPYEFSKSLIKGRIAETVFEQMFRDAGGFTILSFGYENVLPQLAQRQREINVEETMEVIRRAPDFAVIDNKTHEVHLVEVKYMMRPTKARVLEHAERIFQSWKPAYLFLATPEGFFIDKTMKIVEQGGQITPLAERIPIPKTIQDRYTKLLNEVIAPT